jgi:hypothetical protein
MQIQIKNIKVNLAFSEETTCFTADIFVDGKKTAYARNDGHGGCTYYCSYHKPNDDENLRQAEAFAKTLPSTTYNMGGKDLVIESNLEGIIDQAIDDYVNAKEKAKFLKKLEKEMETGFVIGVPNSGNAYSRSFKGKPKLAVLMLHPSNRLTVQNFYNTVKKELKDGEQILNTNLKELGLI